VVVQIAELSDSILGQRAVRLAGFVNIAELSQEELVNAGRLGASFFVESGWLIDSEEG
jgi:hypothetical protein